MNKVVHYDKPFFSNYKVMALAFTGAGISTFEESRLRGKSMKSYETAGTREMFDIDVFYFRSFVYYGVKEFISILGAYSWPKSCIVPMTLKRGILKP